MPFKFVKVMFKFLVLTSAFFFENSFAVLNESSNNSKTQKNYIKKGSSNVMQDMVDPLIAVDTLHYEPNKIKNVTHVIFDLDNTLLNTEEIYEMMLQKLCKNHGKELPKGFRDRFLGSPVEHAIKALKEELDMEAPFEELVTEMKKITEKTYQSTPIKWMPGAERLLKHFHHFGIPMAIATSSFKKEAEIKTSQSHLKELFNWVHHIVTADDVKYGKPAPDIFIIAANKFPDSPKLEENLVFEDSPNGLRAAYTARMQCVFIPEIEITEEFKKKASIIIKTLEDFKPELFGLPPFPKIY